LQEAAAAVSRGTVRSTRKTIHPVVEAERVSVPFRRLNRNKRDTHTLSLSLFSIPSPLSPQGISSVECVYCQHTERAIIKQKKQYKVKLYKQSTFALF
jgi:hypothetical protein